MKTLSLSKKTPQLQELLQMARSEDGILLEDRDGEKYFLSRADEFAVEVDLLRKHHDFLAFLDECKRDDGSTPLDEIERKYR